MAEPPFRNPISASEIGSLTSDESHEVLHSYHSRQSSFPILKWIVGYRKEWLGYDLIAGKPPLPPLSSSIQANFGSADIASLIGRWLTPETGEVFLPNTTTAVRFFVAKERSGFSTRGVLKLRQKTSLRHEVFLPPNANPDDYANSELKSRSITFLFRWHHRCCFNRK